MKPETETSPVPISAASNTQQLNEFKVYETENQKKNKGHSMACPIEQFRTNVLPFVAFDQERKTSSLLLLPVYTSCCSLGCFLMGFCGPSCRDLLLVRIGLGFVCLFSYLLPRPAAARYLLSRVFLFWSLKEP